VPVQVKDKLKDADIGEYATLIQDLQSQVKTGLSFAEVLFVAHSVLGIGASSIRHYYMDGPHGYVIDNPHTSAGWAEVPVWPRINALFQCIMSDTAYLRSCNS
jgi:hypothetical protein